MLTVLLFTVHFAMATEPAPAAATESASSDWAPERWLSAVDAHAGELDELRYSVRRTTDTGATQTEERWRFVRAGARFRVDYFGDTARQVVCDGQVLWDYVPARGAAVRVDLAALPADERDERLSEVLEKVSIPGLRVGVAEGVTWTKESSQDLRDRPTITLHGDGEEDSGLRYWIDEERKVLLRSEIFDGERVVIRTDSRDHREIEPDLWFPHRVDLWTPESGGEIRVRMDISKVSTDTPPDELFDLKLDPAIPVQAIPSSPEK